MTPESIIKDFNKNNDEMLLEVANGARWTETSPIQPIQRLPQEFSGLPNAHNGTHHFLIDDFCKSVATGKLSPTNIWQTARFNIPGLLAHESACNGSKPITVLDLGNPPDDWELLNPDNFPIEK